MVTPRWSSLRRASAGADFDGHLAQLRNPRASLCDGTPALAPVACFWPSSADRCLRSSEVTIRGAARTKPARDGFLARFEREVDPGGRLDPERRRERAEHAKRAYMLGLAKLSAERRRS